MSMQIEMTGALDPRDGWVADRCPMAAALSVVSTRSAFLVLREAFYGATRFDQFVSRTGISEPVAAMRLKELEAEGLLERHPYQEPGQRTRHEYALTEKGADLLPVLISLMRWGDKWAIEGGSRVELTHAGCGGIVGVSLACSEGHGVATDQVELAAKPGRRVNPRSSAP
ncbi:MAG TPA: helix-turn-helix domain-containing protein [Solirubrobacteraceae bacterium]|nr:helix-turn-helix domain-containing protein [Solirubrobacteraceae bacterium]